MKYRERFIESLTFGKPDRLLFHQSYGLMPGVIDRWHKEGLPLEIDEKNIFEYMGLDTVKRMVLPVNFGLYPPIEKRTILENEKEKMYYDNLGVLKKINKGYSTLSYPIKFPVKDQNGWKEYKSRLQYHSSRIGNNIKKKYLEMIKEGIPVRVSLIGFYWFPRDLMGDEELCLSYYTQPDLIHDIINTYAEMIYKVSEELFEKIKIDVLYFNEDMCYKNNMMISPEIFKEFMMPHYKKLTALYSKHGTKIFSVDTDGNLSKLIPLVIESGINVISPLEVNAGNDIVTFRKEYGKSIAFMDGLNKLAIGDEPVSLVPGHEYEKMDTKKAIDLELEYRLPLLLNTGGYIVGLDHRVIVETSLKNYEYYINRVKQYMNA